MRSLQEGDLPLTRAWRNHPDSRDWFNSTDEIPEEDHRRWFESYLAREDDFVFITEIDSVAVAQSALYDILDGTAEFGRLLVAPDARGRGLSHVAIALTLRCADELLNLDTLRLEVKPGNSRAIAGYEKAGFVIDPAATSRAGETLVMVRTRA